DTPKKIIPFAKDSKSVISKGIQKNLEKVKEALVVRDVDNILTEWMGRPQIVPKICDVVIIGGGAIGSSIAYWLRRRVYADEFKVVVVERDPMYTTASTTLSVGGLRQQFSLKENIEMSLFGAEFLRNVNSYLGIEGEPPVDVSFHPYGYLTLASEKGAATLAENSKLQNFLGAKNILLSPAKLKDVFPWINTEGIELGCLGLEKEGWFDPWALLSAFKKKAIILGAKYISGEVQGFFYKNSGETLDGLIIKTKEGEIHNMKFAIAIVAAGAFSGQVVANVKAEDKLEQICLPVEPRREGLAGTYICGRSPEESEEPSIEDLNVDHDYFDEKVWPILAQRIPVFEQLKLKSSWAGYYEYNTFDQNGIIGVHPYYQNLIFATGFSGHGIQQSPAVGRAISELIMDGEFKTLDLSNLNFKRIIYSKPVRE
ncbi:unnamed protein product, partial [Heterotrigona itama]